MYADLQLIYEALVSPHDSGYDNADIPMKALKGIVRFEVPGLGNFALPALISHNTRVGEVGNWRITIFNLSGHVGIQHYGFNYPENKISFNQAVKVLEETQPHQVGSTLRQIAAILYVVVKPECLPEHAVSQSEVYFLPYESSKRLLSLVPDFLDEYAITGEVNAEAEV
jgi:hypothetical protein